MIIVCPSCEKRFNVDENLIPDKGRLLKCGNCNQTWFFNKNVSEQTEPLIYKPAKQKKILYKDEKINKSVSKAPIKPGSELTSNFLLQLMHSIIIVFIYQILIKLPLF